jgi:hypothetical protein
LFHIYSLNLKLKLTFLYPGFNSFLRNSLVHIIGIFAEKLRAFAGFSNLVGFRNVVQSGGGESRLLVSGRHPQLINGGECQLERRSIGVMSNAMMNS